jgi:hypothetical protein
MNDAARERQRDRCRANRQKNKNYNCYKQKTRSQLRDKISILKESQACMDCGFFYPAPIMEYDHRPGEIKLATVAHLVIAQASWKRIEAEIAKCDLVCANCHRYRTHVTRKEVLNPTRKAPERAFYQRYK